MQINLRKANALQAEIRRAIAAAAPQATVTVNEFTADIAAALDEAHARHHEAFMRQSNLTQALYNIRNSVATANAVAGIPQMLGNIERADAMIALHEKIISAGLAKSQAEIAARIEKMRNSSSERSIYGDRFNSVETTVHSQVGLDVSRNLVREHRRGKQALQDQLLAANINTLIEIDVNDLQVLKNEGLL